LAAATIYPSRMEGVVDAPPSKSYTHRAIAVALLARGVSRIINPLYSDDTRATITAARLLGARIEESPGMLEVYSAGEPGWTPAIDCRESGTTLRVFYAIAGLQDKPILLHGRGRLHERPLAPLARSMEALGAKTLLHRGCCPPAAVMGPMEGGYTELDATESSQYLTALLIALSRRPPSTIRVLGLSSRGYVEVTIRVLEAFSVDTWVKGDIYGVEGPPKPSTYRVPGDWSSAAPLLAIGAVAGRVAVRGLDPDDPQPDRAVIDYLRSMGALVEVRGRLVESSKPPEPLRPLRACIDPHPDLAPVLAALAATACGESRICCISRLRLKESDRVDAIIRLLAEAGVEAGVDGDCIVIEGVCGSLNPPGDLHPVPDHRIVMAAAVLAAASSHPVRIHSASAVAKSYPGFWDALSRIGRVRFE